MVDFLSHLLMRSTATQPATAVLQPRLPSLFEPLRGPDEISVLSPDPAVKENFTPAGESSVTGGRKNGLSIGSSTITPDYRPSSILESENLSPDPKPMTLNMRQETEQSRGGEIQAVKTFPSLAEPRQMTIASDVHESLVETKLLADETHSSTSEESGKALFVESRPARTQAAEENFPTTEMLKNRVEIHVRPITEDSFIEEEVRSNKTSLSLKTEASPITVLQSLPTSSRRARMPELEQPQERQAVVEIHIGRIEVRAVPPSTPVKGRSQPTGIMSLEDYLRSQSGDKR
jgi:hypothetical protein